MAFEVTGKLHRKFDTEVKGNNFSTREFVLEVKEGNYPEFVKFQLTQERTALIDPIAEGETLKVHFDLRGREWQGKYFTNLNAWRIEKSEGAPTASSTPPPASDALSSLSESPYAGGTDDDLPF